MVPLRACTPHIVFQYPPLAWQIQASHKFTTAIFVATALTFIVLACRAFRPFNPDIFISEEQQDKAIALQLGIGAISILGACAIVKLKEFPHKYEICICLLFFTMSAMGHYTSTFLRPCEAAAQYKSFVFFWFKLWFGMIGCTRVFIPFLVCEFVYYFSGTNGTDQGFGEIVIVFCVGALLILLNCMLHSWKHLVYYTWRQLRSERHAMDSLLSLNCDAKLWVTSNGDRIVKSDQAFSDIIGRDMTTAMLEDCFVVGSERLNQLTTIFGSVVEDEWPSQVTLLPSMSLSTPGGVKVVDLFIIPQKHIFDDDSVHRVLASQLGFLVGVRICRGRVDHVSEHCMNSRASCMASLDDSSLAHGRSQVVTQQTVPDDPNLSETWSSVSLDDASFMMEDSELEEVISVGVRDTWVIKRESMELDETLPVRRFGAFGTVSVGVFHGSCIFVKILRDATSLRSAIADIRVLRRLKHPNIAIFYGVVAYLDAIALCHELIDGMTVDSLVDVHAHRLSNSDRKSIVLDVSSAIWYLHTLEPRVVHGDLHPSSVVVTSWMQSCPDLSRPHAKLIMSSVLKPMGRSSAWAAPEVMIDPEIQSEPSVDVFSFGRLMIYIIIGQRPVALTDSEIEELAMTKLLLPLPWPAQVPFIDQCRSLCEQCLSFAAVERPDIADARLDISRWQTFAPDSKLIDVSKPCELVSLPSVVSVAL